MSISSIAQNLRDNYIHVNEKDIISILELLPLSMLLGASENDLVKYIHNTQYLKDELWRKYN